MHSAGFILAVKDSSGNILREVHRDNYPTVFLPFYSEYKLNLQNKYSRRAVVSVSIDGTDVLGGRRLVLDAWGSMDLERFLVDGNLHSGRKFQFVPLSDSRVQNPSSLSNGKITVTFTLEKEPVTYWYPSPIKITPWWGGPQYKWRIINIDNTGGYRVGDGTFNPNSSTSCFSMQSFAPATEQQRGATVEGSQSNQSFGEVSIGPLEDVSTTLTLQILAPETTVFTGFSGGTTTVTVPLTVKNTRKKYCTNCGKKLKFQDNFCSKCGKEQPKL